MPNTSILRSTGSILGKSAAYVVHGTALGASQLAIGAAEGYTAKAAELRTRRLGLVLDEPVVRAQKKVAVKAA